MTLRSLLTIIVLLAGTSSTMANCYEGLGCDDSENFSSRMLQQASCQQLWELRNMIFQQNGYCFQTERGKQAFGTEGCHVTSQAAVQLNAFETRNVATIAAVEKAKGCS